MSRGHPSATGARRWQVFGYILWRATLVAVAGTAAGFVMSEILSDVLARVLGGLPMWDIGPMPQRGAALIAAALAGALLPAWGGARADPAEGMARLE